MQGFSPDDVLRAWERCASAPVSHRARTLLGLAEVQEIDRLPIGERDRLVLELRAATFGSTLDVLVTCPACREPLELAIAIRDIAAPSESGAHTFALADGGEVQFRLLCDDDLLAASRSSDPERVLYERAIVHAPRELTSEERAQLGDRMSELDPTSDIQLGATCPACAHAWTAELDPAAFVHAEMCTAAERILREVATLARVFGWTEPAVLALSPARRRAYLDMADSLLGAL